LSHAVGYPSHDLGPYRNPNLPLPPPLPQVIRDLELMPEFLGQNWSGIFLQRFEGTVTVWPKTRLQDWARILTDPDRKELARMMDVGQRVTWPKVGGRSDA
jgi:hypothetical protein